METERRSMLLNWVEKQCGIAFTRAEAMDADASTRRYYRLHTKDRSFIGVDAPPPENCQAFIAIAHALAQQGLHTPQIFNADLDKGFMLVSDFGRAMLLNTLTLETADRLYHATLDSLVTLQACTQVKDYALPRFSVDLMLNEWAWHKEWFLEKLLGLTLHNFETIDKCYQQLVQAAISQPQVFMHRDYHSANLMVIESLPAIKIGVLDFQDAFIGPITYDLVSLLRDCYLDWPSEKVSTWALYYYQQLKTRGVLATVSEEQFLRWFDWMGLQRHLKALMTFARKQVRDQKSSYLQHIPRTLNYIRTVSAGYPELAALHDFYNKVSLACVQ